MHSRDRPVVQAPNISKPSSGPLFTAEGAPCGDASSFSLAQAQQPAMRSRDIDGEKVISGERTKKLTAVAFVLRLRSIRMIYVVDAKFLRVVPPEMSTAVWSHRLAPSEDRAHILKSCTGDEAAAAPEGQVGPKP